ncbi:MAG TPA: Crp/Fnr family transcriptional regulator [Polyangia bacterium]|nr:Crp/Fnr family transcriptional regulator [Polyangia bacterium]
MARAARPSGDLDPLLVAAVAQSMLAKLPAALTAQVLDGGYRIDLPAGAQPSLRTNESAVALVLEGLVRMFLVSDTARQVTVRYARPGEMLGLVHLFARKTEVHSQAVTATSVWMMAPARVRALCEQHAALATAVAEECATRASDAIEELSLLTFGSVRQRVARHLLDLAAQQQQAGELVAAVTQQELADAAGTVREVVARVLKQLHQTGVTAGSDDGVVILDAARLDAEATSGSTDAT